jgi:glycosyltransferase involved in cell wall biosynthesis
MRVALTIDFSPWSGYYGGAQQSTHALACALAARGHGVDVIYTKPPWERVAVPSGLPYAVRWAALPAWRSHRAAPLRPLSAWAVRRAVAAWLDEVGPAQRGGELPVVHTQGEEGALLAGLRPTRRFVWIATPRHPRYPAAFRGGIPRRGGAAARAWLREGKYVGQGLALEGADRVCPPSAYAGQLAVEAFGLDPARVEPVPNGVDPEFLAVERAPLAADGPVVCFGRLEPDKAIPELLEAWSRLPRAGAASGGLAAARPLVILGRGSLEGLVRAAATRGDADPGRPIELRPWTSRAALAQLLAQASLAVLPSHVESFGNAIAEALAAGTPVLSAAAAAIPELVRDGETGVLVPPGDAAALGRALEELLADPGRRERLGAAGRAWAREHLAWSHTAARFEAIYLRAAEDEQRGSAGEAGAAAAGRRGPGSARPC